MQNNQKLHQYQFRYTLNPFPKLSFHPLHAYLSTSNLDRDTQREWKSKYHDIQTRHYLQTSNY